MGTTSVAGALFYSQQSTLSKVTAGQAKSGFVLYLSNNTNRNVAENVPGFRKVHNGFRQSGAAAPRGENDRVPLPRDATPAASKTQNKPEKSFLLLSVSLPPFPSPPLHPWKRLPAAATAWF